MIARFVYANTPLQPGLRTLAGVGLFLYVLLAVPFVSRAEEPVYDETSVFLNISGYGGTEMEALIKDEEVYLSVSELFNYLKIQHEVSSDLEEISGFFISQGRNYKIEKATNQITLDDRIFRLDQDDMILAPTGLYLNSAIYGKVFGLDLTFHFRSLSVILKTKLDLPVVREKRQELMRQNLNKIKHEVIADTTIQRKYPAFNFGAYDWSVNSTQQPNGEQDTRLTARVGTIIAGGETNLGLIYDSRRNFSLRDQQYLWRHVNNDRKGIRQITAGKIPLRSTATLYGPVIGMQLTNAPTTYRRSFGSYDLSDHTEPGWIVELYINNVLVDYVKADASGFFSFKVPLMYGNTHVQLRFFGPWGEERKKDETISVPYEFLPKRELEYTFSAGILENGQQDRFSRLDVKYGLNERITIGTGTEYLSALAVGSPVMPFINASARIGPSLILSGDYTYGVRGKGALNYRLPKQLVLQIEYTRYTKGQQTTFHRFLEERKAMISKPFRTGNLSGYSRLSINQIIYPQIRQTTGDLLLSASVKGVGVNLTTYGQAIGDGYVNVYSSLALAVRLPGRMTFRPQIQYGYKYSQIQQVRAELERQIFKMGYLNLSYQNNLNINSRHFNLGMRFDLAFARTSFSARNTDHGFTFSQSLSGGGILDMKTSYSRLNNRTNVGKGGLIVYSFLDLNLNNKRDHGEPRLKNLDLQVNGGRIENSVKDTTIRIFDLEAYNDYLLELKPTSFDNISYQVKNKTYKVAIEPNKLKLLEIPVIVAGEASGTVLAGNSEEGQGRIIVNFLRDGVRVARTISESDGYFNYLGLPPGTYTAQVDSAQLAKLNLTATPRTFTIKKSLEGDIADGLDLRLAPRTAPLLAKQTPSNDGTTVESAKKKITATEQQFLVVARGTGDPGRAAITQRVLGDRTGKPVEVSVEGSHTFSVRVGGFKTLEQAQRFVGELTRTGFKGAFVLSPAQEPANVKEGHSPARRLRVENNRLLYAIIIGQADAESELVPLRALIRQALRIPSYPMKKGGIHSLQIIGFRDEEAAAQALRKLKARGISGYLQSYQEREVRTMPVK